MLNKKLNFVKKDEFLTVLKKGRKIKGFIQMRKYNEFGYAFGKPSDANYLLFYGNKKPLTLDDCKKRLLNQLSTHEIIINNSK